MQNWRLDGVDKCKVGLAVVFKGIDSDQRSKRTPPGKKSYSKSVSIVGIKVTATIDVKGAIEGAKKGAVKGAKKGAVKSAVKGAIVGAVTGGPVGAAEGAATGAVKGAAKGPSCKAPRSCKRRNQRGSESQSNATQLLKPPPQH